MHELLLAQPSESAPDLPTDQIEAWLRNQRFLLRDEQRGTFLLCGNPAATQYTRMRLLTEPDEPLPTVVLVRIQDREIQIWQRAEDSALLQAKELVQWLVTNLECRIMTPEGDDMTERLDEEYAGLPE